MKLVPGLRTTLQTLNRRPLLVSAGVLIAAACQSNSGGLDRNQDNGTDSGTTNTSTSGGSGGTQAGAAGEAGADNSGDSGGATNGAGSTTDGEDSDTTGSGGTTGETSSGGSGTGGSGAGGTGGTPIVVGDCTFHSDPVQEGAGGQGGAGSEDIQIASNNFIGDYLVDAGGRSLYIYGADFPGDCENEPVSNCTGDCVLSWPVFDAGARSLAEGLPDELFGSFTRSDGVVQTTYNGWPLYYYKSDVAAGDLIGHGKGKTWLGAETELPNVLVMRASEEDGGIKYLATDTGRTLYAFAGDVLGTAEASPESACVGDCLNDYQPFVVTSLSPASPIDPADITLFVREDSGELQVAYKGAPLYTTDLDVRSGELQGLVTTDWSVSEL